VGGSEKSPFLWSGGSEDNRFFLQQMFKMMPLRLHACTQSCYPLINGLVDDTAVSGAITVTWKTRHFRHFTSEQRKVSKSKV